MSMASEALATLPSSYAEITQLKASFASKGLNAKDLAILSGIVASTKEVLGWSTKLDHTPRYQHNIENICIT